MNSEDFEHKIASLVDSGLRDGGVPSAKLHNSMTIGNFPFRRGFRPNNYRRYVHVRRFSDSAFVSDGTTMGFLALLKSSYHASVSSKKIITIKDFKHTGITLQIFKDTIVGIFEQKLVQGKKYWYWIERDSLKDIDDAWEVHKDLIRSQIDSALNLFLNEFNLGLNDDIKWMRAETGIKGDKFLDSLPRDLIIYDVTGRKAYKDEWEFVTGKDKDPLVHAHAYIHNRALEDIAPSIAHELHAMRMESSLVFLKNNVHCIDDLFTYAERVRMLSTEESEIFSMWIMQKFGG